MNPPHVSLAWNRPNGIRDAASRIRPQLWIFTVLSVLWLLVAINALPPREEWLGYLESFFRSHGYVAIGPISFLENLAGVNVAFPGSVTILVAMAYSAGDPALAVKTFLTIVLPSLVAHHADYFLGRRLARRPQHGGYERYGSRKALLLTFATTLWHPHFAAVACMDSGAQRVPYHRFASFHLPCFAAWNLFWGVLMYTVGPQALRENRLPIIAITLLLAWTAWDLFGLRLRVNHEPGDHASKAS